MIEPESPEQLLTKIPKSDTVTLTGKLSGWLQEVSDIRGHLLYTKDVSTCTATGNLEVFEEWWEHNDVGQVIYNKDSDGLECWFSYDEQGREAGYRDNTGKATGVFALDKPLTGVEEKKSLTVEQRLEAIESSVDHLSQQMKLIINSMVVEHKLGDYE